MDSYMSEMMVALGLTNKMVGVTKFIPDNAMPEPCGQALSTVKTVGGAGGNYASKEAMVATHPDLVMSIYPSVFAAATKTVPTVAEWEAVGGQHLPSGGRVHGDHTEFRSLLPRPGEHPKIFGVPGLAPRPQSTSSKHNSARPRRKRRSSRSARHGYGAVGKALLKPSAARTGRTSS